LPTRISLSASWNISHTDEPALFMPLNGCPYILLCCIIGIMMKFGYVGVTNGIVGHSLQRAEVG